MPHLAPTALMLALLLLSAPLFAEEAQPEPAPLPTGVSAFAFQSKPGDVKHTIPLEKVRKGIPVPDPRDRIRSILKPHFETVADATFLRDDQRVIEVVVGTDARAYPIYILDRHELVNDTLGDIPVLVSWCPLCGSSIVYDRNVKGHTLTFGVSGYLYQSDVLMYDHQTESFWNQIQCAAVVGPMTGTHLKQRPSTTTTWKTFRTRHPKGQVLSENQGLIPARLYRGNPYQRYLQTERLMFPVEHRSDLLSTKAEVVGVTLGGASRAYPLAELRRLESPIQDTVGGHTIQIAYVKDGDEVHVRDEKGEALPALRCYWFAWFTFHPQTDVWKPAAAKAAGD